MPGKEWFRGRPSLGSERRAGKSPHPCSFFAGVQRSDFYQRADYGGVRLRMSIPAVRFLGFTFVENVFRMKSSVRLPASAPSLAPSRPAVTERAVIVRRRLASVFSAVRTVFGMSWAGLGGLCCSTGAVTPMTYRI